VDRSLNRLLLAAAFASAFLFSRAQAQENAFSLPDNDQIPWEKIVVLDQKTPGNLDDACYITLLKSPPGFEMNASLLFLQPLSGNLQYATLIHPFPFISPHWEDQSVNPDFTPAFNVGMRYDFGSGADVQLSWTSLNTFDGASAHGDPTPVFVPGQGTFFTQALGPPNLVGPPPPFTNASAVAHFSYDAVDGDAGLWLSAGNHVHMRIFAGLEGARVSQSLSANFQSPDGLIGFNDTSRSVFIGIGPRLGSDAHCTWGNFDFLVGLAGAMLIGGVENHIDFLTSSPTVVQNGLSINPQSLTSPDAIRVVPSIDARVACNYSIPVGRYGTFKCEAGYQAAAYFNAVTQYALSEVEDSATFHQETDQYGGVFLRTTSEQQSNFLVHGPYLKFTFEF